MEGDGVRRHAAHVAFTRNESPIVAAESVSRGRLPAKPAVGLVMAVGRLCAPWWQSALAVAYYVYCSRTRAPTTPLSTDTLFRSVPERRGMWRKFT